MRITQNLPDKLTATPKAMLALKSSLSVQTYHENYGARHPLASYNISLSHVADRVVGVLDALEATSRDREFANPKSQNWEVPLLEATDHMLDSLVEHIEDCGGIIRSFFESSDDKVFKSAYKSFKKAVDPYRDHVAKVVNYLKHNQGRLRAVSFYWNGGDAIGYFVEGPVSSGGLGPVGLIHPGESTAFSYNRDVPYHLCHLYAISSILATTLHSINKQIKSSGPKGAEEKDKPTNLSIALSRAAKLPQIFFEDELAMNVPRIHEGSKKFVVEYPCPKSKPKIPPAGCRIGVFFKGDGVTRQYKLPYFESER